MSNLKDQHWYVSLIYLVIYYQYIIKQPVESAPAALSSKEHTKSKGPLRKRNAIYHFFEEVSEDEHGNTEEGTKYYKSWHGNRKILKITAKMNNSITGKISYIVWEVLNFRKQDYKIISVKLRPPTRNFIRYFKHTLSLQHQRNCK